MRDYVFPTKCPSREASLHVSQPRQQEGMASSVLRLLWKSERSKSNQAETVVSLDPPAAADGGVTTTLGLRAEGGSGTARGPAVR